MNYVNDAIKIIGTQRKTAELCGIRQQSVFCWLKKGIVPARHAIRIEKATGGKITRYQLNPQVFLED